MSFVSYAQNYEDVMLWRALKHVENGFYIDIGAWSPDVHSVTKAFYERSWSGINVEPNPESHALYLGKRTRDVNLCVAVSDEVGEGEMYFVSNPGLSSLDKSIAEGHIKLGWEVTPEIVKLTTLNHICKKYCDNKDIHFLKVDVEGFEGRVLKGLDWTKYRPWIVVVEATLPMTQIESYDTWEPTLLEADYSMVYADGLNRFYVAKERQDLKLAFKFPANIFDKFKLATEVSGEVATTQAEEKATQAEDKATQAETKAKRAEDKATQAETKAKRAEAKAKVLHVELHSVYNSLSWRMTRPFRVIKQILRSWVVRLRQYLTLVKSPKSILSWFLVKVGTVLTKHPSLKARVVYCLDKIPNVGDGLRRLVVAEELNRESSYVVPSEADIDFADSSSSQRITATDYFESNLPEITSRKYNLGIDFSLIKKIREDGEISYSEYSGEKLQSTITHIYLALLFRVPSIMDIQNLSLRVNEERSFKPLINKVKVSTEFKLRGRKECLL